ncbi:MAG: carbohydrate ABC transporter permease [Bacillota bacterium]
MSTDLNLLRRQLTEYRPADSKPLSSRIKAFLLYGYLIVLAVGQIFPLIWLFNYSLVKSGDLFGAEFFKIPNPPLWQNFVRAWVDGQIFHYFINSLIVVGFSVVLSVLFSFLLAYACTRMQWKMSGLVYGFVLMGMMIPIHATLLPNFLLFNKLSLLNTHLGLIIPYVAFTIPFNTILISGFLKPLHRALEESAMIDGCSVWSSLLQIIAPISKPALITTAIMTFMNNWNEFIMANTYLSTEDVRTLPFSVIKFVGYYRSDYAIQFACMTIVAIPSLLIYFLLNKYITEGVTAGAIKG